MSTEINNVTELQAISDDLAGDYILGNDIPCSGTAFTMLSGTFTGTLDGQGYSIKNLTITKSGTIAQTSALFDVNAGTISHVHLVDCVITVTSTNNRVWGAPLVLNNSGAIEDCSATGTVTCTGSVAYVGYSDGAGLIVGNLGTGTITKSYSTVSVTVTGNKVEAAGFVCMNYGAISESYASGNATGTASNNAWAAGFVCENDNGGTIDDCYARGNSTITGDTGTRYVAGFIAQNADFEGDVITNCYSSGTTTTTGTQGGFCAVNDKTITACFWDTETSGDAASDGGTGKTTAQMKTQTTFTDASWDFVTIWEIIATSNGGYPRLKGGSRCVCIPDVLDDHGRVAKGARVRAYRNDTHTVVAEGTIDANGNATICGLPNDVDVSFHVTWGGSGSSGNERWFYSDIKGITEGGTGSSNALAGRTNLGLGTGDSPQFTAVNLGNATDTTLARAAAGRATLEGVAVVRGPASATDNRLVKTNGTTGDLVQQTGITADDDNNVSGVAKLTTTSDIELGNATDTTLHRESAGLISVEGSNLIRASDVDDTPVDEQTAVPVSSNWAYDHNAATPSASVHPISDNVDFNLNQAVDLVVMTVANEAALPTEGIGVGQLCFATSELTLHICTVSS